jgi:hypothetical protein
MMQNRRKIQRLGFYEEAVGTLTGLTVDQGFLFAQISNVMLALPREMENKLRTLIGTRIGILHTDIAGKEYLIRSTLEEPNKAVKSTPLQDRASA